MPRKTPNSPLTKSDPTHTKTLRNEYSGQLVELFSNYKVAVLRYFNTHVREPRIQLSAELDVGAMVQILENYAGLYIVNPGKEITKKRIAEAYSRGSVYGDIQIRKGDFVSPGAYGATDWRAIDALQNRNLSALKKISNNMSGEIVRVITDGLQTGLAPPEIAKNIVEQIDGIGIVRARMMARTETITAFNQAAEIRYAQYGYTAWEWNAATGCCAACEALHGKVFRMNSRADRPPLHPNCRCTMLPANTEE